MTVISLPHSGDVVTMVCRSCVSVIELVKFGNKWVMGVTGVSCRHHWRDGVFPRTLFKHQELRILYHSIVVAFQIRESIGNGASEVTLLPIESHHEREART